MDNTVVSYRDIRNPWRRIFTSARALEDRSDAKFFRPETEEEKKERPCILGALANWPKEKPNYFYDSWITAALRAAGVDDFFLQHQVTPYLYDLRRDDIGGNWTRLLYATRDLLEREQRRIMVDALKPLP